MAVNFYCAPDKAGVMIKVLKITGDSLSPEYQEGDFVLMLKVPFPFKPLKQGDVVVFENPEHGTMIKKIRDIDRQSGQIFVVGTHDFSVDSRQFGPIDQHDLQGVVIWHIKRPR